MANIVAAAATQSTLYVVYEDGSVASLSEYRMDWEDEKPAPGTPAREEYDKGLKDARLTDAKRSK